MRIGIDARPLSKQRTGIANYVEGLLQVLPRITSEHEYFLYSNRELDKRPANPSEKIRIDSGFHRVPGALWLLARGAKLARQDAVDVFWSTFSMQPANLPPGVLKVVTVYDLVWKLFPQTTSRYNLMVQSLLSEKAIADADYVIVISRTTQDDLIRLLNVPREKTKLVYPGIDERYKPHEQRSSAQFISRKYAVPERYMATVGIVHPRKNHQFLVRALGVLKRRGQLDCPLLIVGPMGWKNSPLFREIKDAGLNEADFRFMGYMPDEDMPLFYSGAQSFLFPTLYEGFGLPPVEAMACGSPVISSDAPAMPEVLGDAAVLTPLTSAEQFADSVREVMTNQTLRETLRIKGLERAASFRYENSARELLKVFQSLPPKRR